MLNAVFASLGFSHLNEHWDNTGGPSPYWVAERDSEISSTITVDQVHVGTWPKAEIRISRVAFRQKKDQNIANLNNNTPVKNRYSHHNSSLVQNRRNWWQAGWRSPLRENSWKITKLQRQSGSYYVEQEPYWHHTQLRILPGYMISVNVTQGFFSQAT